MQSAALELVCAQGRLSWPGGSTRAAVGRGGVSASKREGDGATPAGTFLLLSILYRRDRLRAPACGVPVREIAPQDGWVDDPLDANYNRLVSLPYPASAEHLWRADAVYDLVVVIGYNVEPVVPGAGSAIFLHIARSDFSPTAGCVAIARDALIGLADQITPGSTITIRL